MTDPLGVFPKDQSGKLRDGIYRHIRHHELDAAMARGWRPVPTNDGVACHHDHYGVLCQWTGKRPWWRRLWAMFRKVPLFDGMPNQ